MRKTLLIVLILIIILIGVVLLSRKSAKQEEIFSPKFYMSNQPLKNKKIAMIIAFRDFRDEEYLIPKQILENAGAEIATVSNSLGKAVGSQGGEAEVDLLLDEARTLDYDAVIFVGGPGAHKYMDNERCHQIAKESVEAGKVLGAICIAPTILAKAGVLKGKRATVWSSIMDKTPIKILQENGAVYQDKSVVIEGKIITANGPASAEEFGEAIVRLLTEQ